MKLVLDEHFSPEIARQLRGRGHDVTTARDLVTGRDRGDAMLLALAAEAGRAVVTADVADFVELHRAAVTSGRLHAGILLISQRRYPWSKAGTGRLVSALEAFLVAHPAPGALRGQALWLE